MANDKSGSSELSKFVSMRMMLEEKKNIDSSSTAKNIRKLPDAPPSPRWDITYVSSAGSRSASLGRTTNPGKHHSSLRSPYRRHSSSGKHRIYSRSSSEERSHHHASSTIRKRDIHKLPTLDKIKWMQMILKSIHPVPRNLAEEMFSVIGNLASVLLQHRVRRLPWSAQKELAKHIAKGEVPKLNKPMMPHMVEIFDGINSINLNIGD